MSNEAKGEKRSKMTDLPPLRPIDSLNNTSMTVTDSDNSLTMDGVMVFKCPICWDEFTVSDQLFMLSCGHQFCKGCLGSHIKTEIEAGNSYNLRCMNPECAAPMTEDNVRQLISNTLFEKYKTFAAKTREAQNLNARACIRCQDVAIYLESDDPKVWPKIQCKKCSMEMCANCRGPWHPGRSVCKSSPFEDDPSLRKWAEDNFAEQCPKCGNLAQKLHGCHYVQCAVCKYEFCFACLEPHNHRNHKHGPRYDKEKVTRYEKAWARRHPYRKYGVYFGYVVLGLLVVSFGLAFYTIAAPYYIGKSIKKSASKKKSRGGKKKKRNKSHQQITVSTDIDEGDLGELLHPNSIQNNSRVPYESGDLSTDASLGSLRPSISDVPSIFDSGAFDPFDRPN